VRRWLITIAIFLFTGAVVNIAVAWGLVAHALLNRGGEVFQGELDGCYLPPDDRQWEVDILRRFGICHVHSVQLEGRPQEEREIIEFFPANEHLVPRWAAVSAGAPRLGINVCYRDLAWGWPKLALRTRITERYGTGFRPDVIALEGGLLKDALWRDGDVPYPLPLRPIVFGFALNTLFYAAILWLLILGPFVLRRFIRVRRGLCPKCAYPMAESSVCTECGRPLLQRAVV
jgi:hypothetical protein